METQGHQLVSTEEDYNIYRLGSMLFLSGMGSIPFLHGILQTPSPRFDEHTTLREKNNRWLSIPCILFLSHTCLCDAANQPSRYVHLQLKLDEDGGIDKLGVLTKF